MTQESPDAGAGNRIEARETGGRWYVQRSDTQFWGEGATLSDAHDDLLRREGEYRTYLEKAGIPPIPVTGLKRWTQSVSRPVGRVLVALALFSLFMVPVSYAISSGIGRGIKEADIKIGGREFWTGIERGIIDFSTEKHDLPPEQVEALRQAVHRIVLRVRPFTSELNQLLEPVDDTAPPAEKQ